MKLSPASSARWMMRIESSWSSLPQAPNIIAPRQSGLTSTPVRPRVRCSTGSSLPVSIFGPPVRRHTESDQGGTMEYMLLIYSPTDAPQGTEEERQAMHQAFGQYTQSLQDAGALVGGDPLQATDSATTVRAQGGETLTTDGPFAETKEWLAGYYKIDVDSLDEAPEWAARVPNLPHGAAIEVRPVVSMPVESPSEA